MNISGYLARLALRATQPETGVRPRVASMFEPTGVAQVVSTHDAADQVAGRQPAPTQAPRREVPVTDRQGRDASPSPVRPGQVVNAAAVVTAAPDDAGSRRSPSPPRTPATPVRIQRADESAAALLARAGDTAPTVPGHDVAARRQDQQVMGTPRAEVALSGDAPSRGGQRAQGTPVVVPSPTPAEQSAAAQSPVDHGARFRHTVPVADVSRGVASTVPPEADPASLPRLHAVRTAEPGAAKPEITVTIGRIEVLTQAPEPPAPRPARPGKGATAPDLSEYLRDRSGR